MRELLATACRAARAGGDVISAALAKGGFRVDQKARADFVTEVDVAAERAIVDLIRAAHPDHAILAEEGSAGGPEGASLRWVIDPLDGTTNFIHGIPIFGVSVGVERDGVPVAGAILDPSRGELWFGARGEGAWLGETRCRVSAESDMTRALIFTGIPFRRIDYLPRYLPGMERVAQAAAGIRRMGSAALDLAWIASGKAEGFWEYGLSRWDLCAGIVLVEEAGGRVTDFAGGQTHLETGHAVVSNGTLHEALLACVRDERT